MVKTILVAACTALFTTMVCFGAYSVATKGSSATSGSGVFNSNVSVGQSEIGQAIQNERMRRFSKAETELNQKIEALRADINALEGQTGLSAAEKKARQDELMKRDRILAEQRNTLIAEANRVNQIIERNVNELLLKASEQVGKKHSVDMMVDTLGTRVTYLVSKYDLTQEMTGVLTDLWRAQGAKFTGLEDYQPTAGGNKTPKK